MHVTRWIGSGVCMGLLLLSGAPALAKEAAPAAQADRQGGDREFLQRALGANALELQLGKLAAERGSTPESRAKAQKMVENHTKLERQLSDIARQEGLSGTPQMSSEQLETYRRVESEPASRFDATFKQTVDAGHVRELAMYQEEVNRAVNPQLRAFSEQRVSALQQAVAEAQQPAKPMR